MKCSTLRALAVLLLLVPASAAAGADRATDVPSSPAAVLPADLDPGALQRPDRAAPPAAAPVDAPESTAPRWICKRVDNVCGLDDPRILSSPAKIDYDRALDSTPALQELRRKGIDPDSPEGRVLRNKGQDELRQASDEVRREKGHCSVWKAIRHTDGREVPDVTEDVITHLDG